MLLLHWVGLSDRPCGLAAALEYEPVPKTKGQGYDEALTAIAESSGLDDLVARLRE